MAVRRSLIPLALLASATAAALSCRDASPTSVPQSPALNPSLLGSSNTSSRLLSCSDLPYQSVTQVIGPAGGTIRIGPHKLLVPAGALASSVSITAVLPTGTRVNAVRLKPNGLRFKTPVFLTLSYANCTQSPLAKQVAYTDDYYWAIYAFQFSVDNPWARTVMGMLDHFSNYAVAW
jgi:hypothetical protein